MIPGKEGGCHKVFYQGQALEPPLPPSTDGGLIRGAVQFQAIRGSSFEPDAGSHLTQSVLPVRKAVMRAGDARFWKHGQGVAAGFAKATTDADPAMPLVVSPPLSPAVSNHGMNLTTRTLTGQRLTVVLTGLALIAGTWDNNNHAAAKASSWSVPGQGTPLQAVAFAPKY
jgi:hypothetical protein